MTDPKDEEGKWPLWCVNCRNQELYQQVPEGAIICDVCGHEHAYAADPDVLHHGRATMGERFACSRCTYSCDRADLTPHPRQAWSVCPMCWRKSADSPMHPASPSGATGQPEGDTTT